MKAGQVAELMRSLGDENRLSLLARLAAGPRSVSALVAEAGLSQPLVSHHLKVLKQSHVIETERRGSFVYYYIPDPAILSILAELSDFVKARTSATRAAPQDIPVKGRGLTQRGKI